MCCCSIFPHTSYEVLLPAVYLALLVIYGMASWPEAVSSRMILFLYHSLHSCGPVCNLHSTCDTFTQSSRHPNSFNLQGLGQLFTQKLWFATRSLVTRSFFTGTRSQLQNMFHNILSSSHLHSFNSQSLTVVYPDSFILCHLTLSLDTCRPWQLLTKHVP